MCHICRNNTGSRWALGWLALGGLAFLLRDWRQLMLALSLPSLLSLLLLPLLPESPRWLAANRRTQQAEQIIRQAALVNR